MKKLLGILIVALLSCNFLFAGPARVIVNPTSLTFNDYTTVGTISPEQIYTVQGNKHSSIIITAPTGFKVSTTSGGSYSASVTVGPYVQHTIYVVFEPTATGTTAGNIANNMLVGHASANVAVTGNNAVSVDDPASFNVSQAASQNEIDQDWTKNVAGDNVMVAQTTDGTFGTPVNTTPYSAGGTVSGGGAVIYNGNALDFIDTGLLPNTLYYYKAWLVDNTAAGNPLYSPGLTGSATTAPEPGVFMGLVLAGLAMVRARS